MLFSRLAFATIALLALNGAALAEDAAAPTEDAATAQSADVATANAATSHGTPDILQPKETDHVLGDVNAPVTVVEYVSLTCHHCANSHINVFPDLKKEYIDTGKVRFILRHFPFGETALRAAMVTECANDKFYTFAKVMFQTQSKWAFSANPISGLRSLANVGGMSNETFDACLADKELETRIIEGVKDAAKHLSINATPTFFVNGKAMRGGQSFSTLSIEINAQLEKANN